MRISVREKDPGYIPDAFRHNVLVDGKEVKGCFTADEETGEAFCYVIGENGGIKVNRDTGHPEEVCHKGLVQIVHWGGCITCL